MSENYDTLFGTPQNVPQGATQSVPQGAGTSHSSEFSLWESTVQESRPAAQQPLYAQQSSYEPLPSYASQSSQSPHSSYQSQLSDAPQSPQPSQSPQFSPSPTMPQTFANQPQQQSLAAGQQRKQHKPGWVALIAASAVAAVVGGAIGVGGNQALQPSSYTSASSSSQELAPVVESTGEAPNWQAVQNAVGDSVVAIDVQLQQGASSGSGVIIDSEGHVLTNDHVISGAQDLYVTLADGRLFQADVVGADEATDLAVIAIQDPPSDIVAAQLGDSSSLHVGQDVAAIGNPLGLSSTMTTGIISALNRPVTTQKENSGSLDFPFGGGNTAQPESVVTNAIQLDAAVNPGNSGGPVFDSAGRVIGIASSIASMSGDSESGSIGLGFAIPINLAKNIAEQLIESGVAEHAFLGVTIKDGVAQYDDVTRLGAEVNSVSDGAPARQAGIRTGDVIISIDGNEVSGATALTGFVRQYRSGDVATVTLERDGELLDARVTLAARQD